MPSGTGNDAETTDVLVVGGGPCGLMLANELGRRGIRTLVVDEKPSTAVNPQANATQARSMEHYRRLGFVDEVRAMGLPAEYPTDIAYFTRYAAHELARFSLPSSGKAGEVIRRLSGSWSAAELPHRVSQKYVEQVLRRHAEALPCVDVRFGRQMRDFVDHGTHVEARIVDLERGTSRVVHSRFMVGADGPRSSVRHALGFELEGEAGAQRDFMGGRMHAIYLRAPHFYQRVPHPRAWMYWTFNGERRAFMAAVDGQGEFAFHTQLKPHETEASITDDVARAMFAQAFGAPIDIEILSRRSWTAGFALVANGYQKGNVYLAGDAVHLFTPAGGLGYNTGIEDAANLGWKLAAVIRGHAPKALADTYQAERRPIGVRNTSYARAFADSMGLFLPDPALEDDSEAGRAARAVAGAYFLDHIRREFDIPGITFGARYDGSPVIVGDGTSPPPDAPNVYMSTACPGGRAPHLWLSDQRSLYDRFGFDWTLLCTRDGHDVDAAAAAFTAAAAGIGMDLKVLAPGAAELPALYGADLALVRPDQVVAWRGAADAAAVSGAAAVLDRVLARR